VWRYAGFGRAQAGLLLVPQQQVRVGDQENV
jgi:hypothetical protein